MTTRSSDVDLPAAVELKVTDTEPGVQGDRVSGARKPATLETGLIVQVPLFVNPGDMLKVDTRSGRVLDPGLRWTTAPPGTNRGERGALFALRGRHKRREPGRRGGSPAGHPDPFVTALIAATEASRPKADALIAEVSVGWPLERLAVVDRLVLELAIAELLDPAGTAGGR